MASSSRRASRSRPCAWIAAVLLLVVGALVGGAERATAAESSFEDRAVTESVDGLEGALGRAVEERERLETLFPRLKRFMGQYPRYIADTEILLEFRTYGFPLRSLDSETAYAWTAGGKLLYRSGWWRDSFQLGAGLFLSQPIVSDDPEARTDLLREGDKGFAVFGEAFVRGRWRDNELTLGRFEIDLPYVNRSDSRMSPNTFQGIFAEGVGRGVPYLNRVDWVAGYLTDIRPRNENDFLSLAERAGALDGNEGMAVIGVQLRLSERLKIGAYDYYVPNTLDTGYVEIDYNWKLSADWALRFQGQGTYQASVGDEQIGDFDTWMAGLRVAGSFRDVTAWVAFSRVSDDAGIQTPFGSYPGYVSLMQSDFNRADEAAWVVGASYAPKIAPRWSGFVQYAQGNGGRVFAGAPGDDEREFDLTVDYRIEEGRFRGLWLRVRGSVLHRDGAPSRAYQGRVILNYTLPVL